MKSNFPVSGKNTVGFLKALFGLAIALPLAFQAANAQTTYTYTIPANSSTVTWTSGTNWSASAPVSSSTGTLVFTGGIASGNNTTSQDNTVGAFQLNTLTLSGSNSSAFAATSSLTISGTAGASLEFAGANSTMNLNANNGTGASFNSIVSMNASIDGTLTLIGNGSSAFTLSGNYSNGTGTGSLIKSGSATVTLSGTNSFSGGTTLNVGTINVNSATALGTGTFTIAGGAINNSGAGAITLTTNNAQAWNGDFSWGGTQSLNLGTGAVTLGGNRVITTSGAGILTVGGGISGVGDSITTGGSGTILLNGTNTYTGGTFINGGSLIFGTLADIPASGVILIAKAGTMGVADPTGLSQAALTLINSASAGTVALSSNSANNLDFSATGANSALSLGATTGTFTYTGTLTPLGTTYRLGGGAGTLVFNSALTGSGNSLNVGGGSAGTVNLGVAGTYNGGTTVGTGSTLQTNLSGTPFGGNGTTTGSITLNSATLGFGTVSALSTAITPATGDLNFSGASAIATAHGTGSVTYTVNSLSQNSGGVLLVKPSSNAALGTTEKIIVTNGTSSVPLTVTNGMIAPNMIDATSATPDFLTYGANGLVDAVTTSNYGAGNIVSTNVNLTTQQNAYALIWTGGAFTGNVVLGSGGFITNGIAQNSNGSLYFNANHGYVYFTNGGANNNGMRFFGTNGITFSGGGLFNNGGQVNPGITGGIILTNGTYSNSNTGEPFNTMTPNALTIAGGASLGDGNGSQNMTFASLTGDGSLVGNSGVAMQITIEGVAGTNDATFAGTINGSGTVNLVKNGSATQTFTGANTSTSVASVTVKNGAIVLSGAGTLGLGSLSVSPGATFTMDNTGGNVNRISGISAISLGGNLNLIGNGTSATSQSTGTLNEVAGNSVITLTATGTQSDQLIFSSLGTRAAGSSGLFHGTGLTGTFTGGSAGTSNIAFTTAPTVSTTGAFVSSGTGTGIQAGVLRGYLFDSSATGGGKGFATVDATSKSIRQLNAATEQTGTFATGNNVLLTSSGTLGASSVANTLQVDNTTGSGFTITNTGGTINAANGLLLSGTSTVTITGGAISFAGAAGNTDLIVLASNTAGSVISSTITNSTAGDGITIGGSGPLTLNGALNAGTGGIVYFNNSGTTVVGASITGTGGAQILAGTVQLTTGGSLPAGNRALTIAPGATLDINNVATSVDAFNSTNTPSAINVNAGGGTVTNTGTTVTNFTVGAGNTGGVFNGSITGSINLVKAGTGAQFLEGSNTYVGTTSITGTLSVAQIANGLSASSIGSSSNAASNLVFVGNNATLQYVGPGGSSDRLFTINGTSANLDGSGYNSGSGLSGAFILTNTGTITFGTLNQPETLNLVGTSGSNVANQLAAQLTNNGTGVLVLNKTGVGVWNLTNGASTYTGTTTVSNGTLGASVLANGGVASSIGQSSNAATNLSLTGTNGAQATLQYTGSGATTDRLFSFGGSNAVGGSGAIDASGSGAIIFSNTGNLGYGTTGQARTLTLTGTSTNLNTFAPTLANNGAGVTSLIKSGVGTWDVTGSNTYTGTTTISSGILVAGGSTTVSGSVITAGPFGTGPIAISAGGGFDDNGTAITLANSVVLASTGTFASTGTGSLTFDGTSLATPATFVLSSAATLTVNNTTIIKDVVSGASSLTQNGTGTLVLLGVNSYTGTTTIAGGTLSTNNLALGGSNSGIGSSSNAATGLVLNGGTLQYTGGTVTTDRSYTLGANGGGFDASGTGSLTISGTMTASATSGTQVLTLTGTNTGLNTLSGKIVNGAGATTAVTKTGVGTWSLSGTNTFTGGVNINGGTLQAASAGALGTAGTISFSGGALQFSSANTTDYSGRFSNAAGQAYSFDTNGQTVTFGTAFGTGGNFTMLINDTATTTGIVNITASGLGTDSLISVTRGELDLNSSAGEIVQGNVLVNGGTLKTVINDQFDTFPGDSPSGSNVTVSSGTFTMGSTNQTVSSLHVTGGLVSSSTGSLTSLAAYDIQAGTVTAKLAGSVALNKSTSGVATLAGANTYTGGTNLNAGTLIVSGSTAASGTFTVGNGTAVATLTGTGTIGGFLTTTTTGTNVAHVAPGATAALGSVGTLNVGNLGFTIGNGTALDYDLNTTQTAGGINNDLIALGGGVLTFGGTTTFNFNALSSLTTGGTYTLISGAGSISGFNPANFIATGMGTYTAVFSDSSSALYVSFVTVSSPTTAYYNGLGSDLNAAGNFDTTVSGTVLTAATATGTTNVYFSANRNTLTAASTSSALSVNSLNFGVGSGTNSGITLSGTSAITITGSNVNGTTGNQGITTTGTGSDSISAPLVLAANQTWSVDTGGTLTVSGTVSGGSSALTKAGAGKLVLSGNNTYSGGTTLSTGTLVLGTSTAGSTTITSGPVGTGTLTLASGSTLQDNGTAITLANAVSVSGTITFSSTGAGSLTFDGRNLTTPSVFTLTGNTILIVNNTTTIDDNIAGNFTLTKQGNGTLNLLGTSSSTAGTTITSGSITIANGASLGSGLISLANGTGLTYTGGAGTLNQNITVASGATGTVSNTGTATLTLAGTLTKADANLILNAGGHTIDVTGAIVSTGATGTFDSDLYVTNGTTIADNSNNSYSGATHIYGNGTLVNGFNNALPTSTVIELGNSGGAATETGASYTNIYQLNGHNQSIAGLTSANPAGFTDSNHVIGGSATLSTLTLTGTASLGEGILGGTGSNANNLAVKFNPGSGKTITLSGSNTYTGGTEVVDGNLLVNNTTGSATGGGTFKLDSGAGLSGTGTITSTSNTINGNVTVGSGGTNTTDVLTMTASGTTTFSGANLTFNLDANSTNSNVLALGSTPSIYFGSGVTTLTLNLLGTGSTNIANGTDYILFTASSASDYKDLTFSGSKITNFVLTLTGTASNGAANSLYYGQSYLILSGNNIEIQVVPEPGTWALMLGGLALLVAFQRVRRSKNV